MKAKSFTELYREAERHDDYWVAGLAQAFLEDLVRAMDEAGISRAELARRLGSTPAYVTKILRGNVNFTLTSLVKLARAVGCELHLAIEPVKTAPARRAIRPAAGGATACATTPTAPARAAPAAR